jgi:hypothetical protein
MNLTGPMGTAERMTIKGSTPDHEAHLIGYLIESRQTGLPWWQFQLSVIHLRPIEGVRPPYLRFPEATHELLVMAYDPKHTVTADGRKRSLFLEPLNFVAQFVATDEKATQLADALVRKVLAGELPLEPQPSAATAAMAVTGQGPWLDDRTNDWRQAIADLIGDTRVV